MSNTPCYGAVLERGTVIEFADGKSRIQSLSRPGIITPPLPSLPGLVIQIGDTVHFCLYDDGTGLVIAKMD